MRFSTFLKEFPKQIPTSYLGDVEKKINISEKMAKQICGDFPRLLIYRGKRGDRSYRCTCCDGVIQEAARQRFMTDLESNLFSATHGERDVMCPLCMAPCKVVNAAKWNLQRHDEYRPVVFEYIHKAQKGELVCLFTYDVARSLYEGSTGTVYQAFEAHCEDLFVLRRGGAAQYKYYRYSNTFHLVSSIITKDGQKQMYGKGFQEPFISHTWSIANMRYDLKHHPDGLYRKDSFLKYVPGEMVDKYDSSLVLAYSAVFPSLEMFFKAKLYSPISRLFYRKAFNTTLYNFAGRDRCEVFPKLDAKEIKAWAHKGGNVDVLSTYMKIRQMYRSPEEAMDIAYKMMNSWMGHFCERNFIFLLRRNNIRPDRLHEYLLGLVADKKDHPWGRHFHSVCEYWDDYIRAAEGAKLDLSREEFTMPKKKKLAERHDVATSLWRNILAERETVEMKELCEKLKEIYGYTAQGYTVIVPRSSADIIAEGKAQNNCVAGYADRHKKGVLAIVFIRKEKSPDKSLITVEMHGDKVWQARRAKNRSTEPEDKAFIEEWTAVVKKRLEEIEKNKKRKEKTAAAVGVTA